MRRARRTERGIEAISRQLEEATSSLRALELTDTWRDEIERRLNAVEVHLQHLPPERIDSDA